MNFASFAALLGFAAALASGCSRTLETNPMPETARTSVSAVSIELSGSKMADTSGIGARGADEGASRSAAQIGTYYYGSLGGLAAHYLIKGVAAAKGAVEAQPEQVVDDARSSLQAAVDDTDFAGLLRARLASSRAAGSVQVAAVAVSPAPTPLLDATGRPVDQLITLNYRLLLLRSSDRINPSVGIVARVTARVLSPDRKHLFHAATWTYCGERHPFVEMGANNAAIVRRQMDTAGFVLSEAVLYDLYVNKKPRKETDGCMDFSDLPAAASQPKA
jgi:hypothetical protein